MFAKGKVKVVVALAKGLHVAGDRVEGSVTVDMPKRRVRVAQQVNVLLWGVEVCKFKVGGGQGNIVSEEQVVWRQEEADSAGLLFGQHMQLPFVFRLPTTAPASINDKKGHVAYGLHATVVFKDGKHAQATATVRVVTSAAFLTTLALRTPLSTQATALRSTCCLNRGTVDVVVRIVDPPVPIPSERAMAIYSAGDRIQVEVEVHNTSSKAIQGLQVQFMRVVRFYTPQEPVPGNINPNGGNHVRARLLQTRVPAGGQVDGEVVQAMDEAARVRAKEAALVHDTPIGVSQALSVPGSVGNDDARSSNEREECKHAESARGDGDGEDDGGEEEDGGGDGGGGGECTICMDSAINAVFVPCGHMAACFSCAQSMKECPICRQPASAVKTFNVHQ